jgi:hypothetical protein
MVVAAFQTVDNSKLCKRHVGATWPSGRKSANVVLDVERGTKSEACTRQMKRIIYTVKADRQNQCKSLTKDMLL